MAALLRHRIDEIEIPPRLRDGINEETVVGLMDSIQRIGLQTPPTIRPDDEGDCYVLVSGAHRLEACRRLGMQLVECIEWSGSVIDARLWEIAENLHRADLTVQERAEHIAEWVRITEESAVQSAQLGPIESKRADGRGHRPQSGINAAVKKLGITRQEGQRAVKIAGLAPEAKEAARAAGLDDHQSALLTAARESDPQQQVHVLRRIAEEKSTIRAAPHPLNDIETEEQWMGAIMRVWNRGAPQWRERFLETVDRPVFDSTGAAA